MMPEKKILTVSELTKEIKFTLEQSLGLVWVTGEVSNLRIPSSGHVYFTLKDERSQVRVVIFRSNARYLPKIEDGTQILLRGPLSVYEARGEYQIIGEYLELSGVGNLQIAFKQLKEKLYKEGLFDTAYKKVLPPFPKNLGIVTSPTGAAVKDILNIAYRRYPLTKIVIYPSLVQGNGAPASLVKGVRFFNQSCPPPDIILLTRGGGSLEDLWAFNDETLARAIFESKIPVVSAVGHEIDFTISDLVADVRVPTPSAAAEIILPDIQVVQATVSTLRKRMNNVWKKLQKDKRTNYLTLSHRLSLLHPQKVLNQHFQRLDDLDRNVKRLMLRILEDRRTKLKNLSSILSACSSDNVLKRGFSICRKNSGEIVTNHSEIALNERLSIQLAAGSFESKVEKINPAQ